MDNLSVKTLENFKGKIVRKDLTNMMKRGVNVPGYVLEYLLGMYCSTNDQNVINAGIKKIVKILSQNYVRYDEIEKIKFELSEKGEYTIIDKIVGKVDEDNNRYLANFTNFNIGTFILEQEYAQRYPKVFSGGVWCMAKIKYDKFVPKEDEEKKDKNVTPESLTKRKGRKKVIYSPYSIAGLKPIQVPNINFESFIEARQKFTLEEWMILMLRSSGIEGANLNEKERYHFIERLVPLFERNYNLVELGPRGTGKSHVYKEISPYSVLISGGQTTISSLFYNVSRKTIGLVGNWDCIAFDEIGGMGFTQPNGIDVLKDYMASGSFSRGKEVIYADGSMVFLGNINDTVENMLKISHLFSPFPDSFSKDSAFFDRMHYYLPGWEIPKIKAEYLTEEFGLISDCFAEYAKELRKLDYSHAFDEWFKFNKNVTTRDENAIRKTISGLVKILYPDLKFTIEDAERIITYAIEGRRRVKEQLRRIAGDEFSDVDLGYITSEGKEVIVNLPEKASSELFSNKDLLPGHVYSVGYSYAVNRPAAYKIESKCIVGNEEIEIQGINHDRIAVYESLNSGWVNFQENARSVKNTLSAYGYNYLIYVNDLQKKGTSRELSVAEFISLCSATLEKSVRPGLAVMGDVTLTGTLNDIVGLEDYLRVAINAGTKVLLMPIKCKEMFESIVEAEGFKIQGEFYNNVVEAAKYALDIQEEEKKDEGFDL